MKAIDLEWTFGVRHTKKVMKFQYFETKITIVQDDLHYSEQTTRTANT